MSVLHPNGFAVRVLVALRSGVRLRVHTWAAGAPRLATPHDHRSWFVSLPLWGSFVERRYAERAGDDLAVVRCHSTTAGNGVPDTTPAGRGSLRLASESVRRAPVPYYCPLGAVHSLVPRGRGFAASLVLFGPSRATPRAWFPETQSRGGDDHGDQEQPR